MTDQCLAAWSNPVRKSETNRNQKNSLRGRLFARVTFTGDLKGELMCWNGIPPPPVHTEKCLLSAASSGIMLLIWSSFSASCHCSWVLLCTPTVNKARNREGNLQSSKSPSQFGYCE